MNFAEIPPAVAEPADSANPEPLTHESEETEQVQPTKGRTFVLALVIVGCLLLMLSVSIGLFAALDSQQAEGRPLALTLIIVGCLLLVVSILIGLFVALNSHRTKGRTLALALIIVGGLLLSLIPVGFLFTLDAATLAAIGGLIFLLLVAVVVVGGFVGVVLAIVWGISSLMGQHTICPKCNKKYARVEVGRKVVERKKCYGLVTRRAYTSSSSSVSGTGHHWGQTDYQTYRGSTYSSGSTSWQERVPVIRTTYELRYKCKYCHARWIDEEVRQVEDFDIERE